jgi:hypothetical protein
VAAMARPSSGREMVRDTTDACALRWYRRFPFLSSAALGPPFLSQF